MNVAQAAYLDSQGLGALVRARQSVQARGGLMALSEAPQHILRLLEITKLSQIIPAYPNDAAALKAMRAPSRRRPFGADQRMNERERSPIPDGVWIQCGECGEAIFARANLNGREKVCPHCGRHDALSAAERAAYVLDEFDADEHLSGPLHAVGEIDSFPAALAVIDAESAEVSSGGLFHSVAELAGLLKPLIVFAANGTGAGEESAEPRLRLARAPETARKRTAAVHTCRHGRV